jgi:PAS domain S-box-containing protein
MVSSSPVISGSYNYGLVAASVLISMCASCAALDLGGRITAARRWIRASWLLGGATVLGVGIWSMHFTGMLAFVLPIPVAYHWPTVLLSLLAAVLASLAVLFVSTRQKMGTAEALTGSVIMGAGIAGMHFLGMAAMRLPATLRYSPAFVVLAVVIAVLASMAALVFTFDFREETRGTTWAKVTSAAGMGAAISAMHYTGMASASFISSDLPPDLSHTVSISSLGTAGIVIAALLIQIAASVTSSVDRRFAAQAAELQLNERFRQIADISRDVLALSSADLTQVLFVNRSYEAVWGRTVESLYADPMSWLEGVHPADRPQVQEALGRLLDGKPLDYLECRVVRPDGSISWVRLRAYPVLDEHGQPYRIVSTAHEFTNRKLAEEGRRQIEEQHRMVLEAASDAVVIIDENNQVLFVNPAATRIFGYEPSELLGQPLTTLMPETLHGVHKAGLERYLATGLRHINWQRTEFVAVRKNGEEFPVEVSFGEVRTEGRRVFTGFIRDVTDRKRAEEALRSSEREQRRIAAQLARERARLVEAQEVAKMGSWERELQSSSVIWSEQTHRIFETDPSRFHPTRPSFREFIHPEDRARVDAAFLASLDKRSPCTVEYRIVMPDGRVKILEERWQSFHDEEGKPIRVAGTCRDITETVRVEQELRRLSGQLLRLQDEERRRIARDLHDSTGQDLVALATILSQLHTAIPSSSRKLRNLASQGQELADRCIREVRTLSYLLHPPMLDEAGLEDAIRHYVKGFSERTGIEVKLTISPQFGRLPPDVELALFRVVQESLTNIQRHSQSLRAAIQLDALADGVSLVISDKGLGAAPRELTGTSGSPFRLGVGIPSMQERVRLIGGRLEIESTSSGTTVRVMVPVDG